MGKKKLKTSQISLGILILRIYRGINKIIGEGKKRVEI